jgi:hypothetical protein
VVVLESFNADSSFKYFNYCYSNDVRGGYAY